MKQIFPRPAVIIRSAILFFGAYIVSAYSGKPHWNVFVTPHYRIHFKDEYKNTAGRVAVFAEEIHILLSDFFSDAPDEITHIVIDPYRAEVNGFSTEIPGNLVYLYPNPPLDEIQLRYFGRDWLYVMVFHELVHNFHLNRKRGFWGAGSYVFGPLFNSFGRNPDVWNAEGTAIFLETYLAGYGRGRLLSPLYPMIAYSSAAFGNFPSVYQVNVSPGVWQLDAANYIYGSLFIDYLIRTKGKEKAVDFLNKSTSIFPLFKDIPFKTIYGVWPPEMWNEFKKSCEAHPSVKAHNRSSRDDTRYAEKQIVVAEDMYIPGPARADNSNIYYFHHNNKNNNRLYQYCPARAETKILWKPPKHMRSIRLFAADSGKIFFSAVVSKNHQKSERNIYTLSKGRLSELTTDMRVYQCSRNPVSKALWAILDRFGRQELVVFDEKGILLHAIDLTESGYYVTDVTISQAGSVLMQVEKEKSFFLILIRNNKHIETVTQNENSKHSDSITQNAPPAQETTGLYEIDIQKLKKIEKILISGKNEYIIRHSHVMAETILFLREKPAWTYAAQSGPELFTIDVDKSIATEPFGIWHPVLNPDDSLMYYLLTPNGFALCKKMFSDFEISEVKKSSGFSDVNDQFSFSANPPCSNSNNKDKNDTLFINARHRRHSGLTTGIAPFFRYPIFSIQRSAQSLEYTIGTVMMGKNIFDTWEYNTAFGYENISDTFYTSGTITRRFSLVDITAVCSSRFLRSIQEIPYFSVSLQPLIRRNSLSGAEFTIQHGMSWHYPGNAASAQIVLARYGSEHVRRNTFPSGGWDGFAAVNFSRDAVFNQRSEAVLSVQGDVHSYSRKGPVSFHARICGGSTVIGDEHFFISSKNLITDRNGLAFFDINSPFLSKEFPARISVTAQPMMQVAASDFDFFFPVFDYYAVTPFFPWFLFQNITGCFFIQSVCGKTHDKQLIPAIGPGTLFDFRFMSNPEIKLSIGGSYSLPEKEPLFFIRIVSALQLLSILKLPTGIQGFTYLRAGGYTQKYACSMSAYEKALSV